MPFSPPFTRIVGDLPASMPFVGPEAIERARRSRIKVRIGANESAFGISPLAAAAMRDAIANVSWYADPEGFDLRRAIAERFDVPMDAVCLGSGMDELLGLVVRMLVEPGTPVITSLGAYPTFNYHVDGFGGVLHKVPYRDDHIDLEAVAVAAHAQQARLVYLANPDNPMGTWHAAHGVAEFVRALPATCVLILDEAYIDFAPAGTELPIDLDEPRILHMRTFSKAHGMAGARVGFTIAAQALIQGLNKIRNHFGMNRISLAGALASFHDHDFIASVIRQVAAGREEYAALATRLGLHSLPSATNFVAMEIGDGERAREVLNALAERDVFVRMPAVAPLNRCIRVSVGTPQERTLFAAAFEESLTALGDSMN